MILAKSGGVWPNPEWVEGAEPGCQAERPEPMEDASQTPEDGQNHSSGATERRLIQKDYEIPGIWPDFV